MTGLVLHETAKILLDQKKKKKISVTISQSKSIYNSYLVMKRLSIQISLGDTLCITEHVLSTLRDAVSTKQHSNTAQLRLTLLPLPILQYLAHFAMLLHNTDMDSQSKQLKKLDTRKQQQRQKKKKKKKKTRKKSLTSLTISKEE